MELHWDPSMAVCGLLLCLNIIEEKAHCFLRGFTLQFPEYTLPVTSHSTIELVRIFHLPKKLRIFSLDTLHITGCLELLLGYSASSLYHNL